MATPTSNTTFGTLLTDASKSSGTSVREAVENPDSLVFDSAAGKVGGLSFTGYFIVCLIPTIGTSVLASSLWSYMGCAPHCLELLQAQHEYAPIVAGTVFGIILTLYLLDFFAPPHMPGKFLTLSGRRRVFGRLAFVLALVLFIVVCFLAAKEYPTIPLAVTIFLCPIFILIVRSMTMPREQFTEESERDPNQYTDFAERMAVLRVLTGEEKNQYSFYRAAMYAFLLTGVLCLGAWVPWAVSSEALFKSLMHDSSDKAEREVKFVMWAAPLICAISHFIFACFAALRASLNQAYTATDELRNQLTVQSCCFNEDMMNHRMALVQAQLEKLEDTVSPEVAMNMAQDRMQVYLVQHISHMKQLANVVKTTGCAFIVMIGGVYICFQLTIADSHIAQLVQGFIGFCFVTFIVFIAVTFSRLWQAMHHWLQDLPLWKSAIASSSSAWARAFVICIMLPFAPIILALSVANQSIRRCRGLQKQSPGCLTERVQTMLGYMQEWERLPILGWCFFWSTFLIIYNMTPPFLNLLLAWMGQRLAGLNFAIICLLTFMAGMVLFMLPPVPGPPIYLFGGVVISQECPWGQIAGSLICVLLCFVLKLTACATQQQLIGRRLGNCGWVRQTVGVHRPFIRAIEAILRQPGLGFGKCMILCGGPDWPTSVLAGVLKLSLVQCELGTSPIIFFVAPLSLTGSLYVMSLQNEGEEVWTRAGNMMFALSALVSVVMWAGMGWAIQNEFEKNQEALTRPMEEYMDLDWLDHRSRKIAEKCATKWDRVPFAVQALYGAGTMNIILVAHAIFWRPDLCFGTFAINDGVDNVTLFGESGMVKPLGALLLLVGTVSYLGFVVYCCWFRKVKRVPAARASQELDAQEVSWKDARREEARKAATMKPTLRTWTGIEGEKKATLSPQTLPGPSILAAFKNTEDTDEEDGGENKERVDGLEVGVHVHCLDDKHPSVERDGTPDAEQAGGIQQLPSTISIPPLEDVEDRVVDADTSPRNIGGVIPELDLRSIEGPEEGDSANLCALSFICGCNGPQQRSLFSKTG